MSILPSPVATRNRGGPVVVPDVLPRSEPGTDMSGLGTGQSACGFPLPARQAASADRNAGVIAFRRAALTAAFTWRAPLPLNRTTRDVESSSRLGVAYVTGTAPGNIT